MNDKPVYHATLHGILSLVARKDLLFAPELQYIPKSHQACDDTKYCGLQELNTCALLIATGCEKPLGGKHYNYLFEFTHLCPVCRVIVDAALEGNNILPAYHGGKYK